MRDPECIFCKIVAGLIPSNKVFEDENLLAFHDIHPAAAVHFLIIPKTHLPSLFEVHDEHVELLGKMFKLAPKLAQEQGLKGFKTVVHTGADGGQDVPHLHLHVMGTPRP